MANEYIDWFKDIMNDIFPNIHPVDNHALAWGGLGDTMGWVQKNHAEQTLIINANADYKTLGKGTPPCP